MIVWEIHIQYIRSQKRSFKLNIGISGCRLRRVAKSVSTCVNSSGSAAEEATERFMAGIEPRFDLVLQDMWTKKNDHGMTMIHLGYNGLALLRQVSFALSAL